MTTHLRSERGSMPMALLMSIAIAGMLSATFTVLLASTEAVQSDRAFTYAIQVADAGLNQALQFVNEADPDVTPTIDSATLVGNGNTATDTLLGEQFSWTATYDASAREWQMRSTSTIDGRSRTIEASARRVGIFQTGAFADDYLAFTSNHVADSYPIMNVGSVGSNNTIILSNNSEPDIVVIAGDATCTQQGGACLGESNQGHTYLVQPSNRFDIDRVRTQIDNDIAALCPPANQRTPITFTSDTHIATTFSGGGIFCYSSVTFPNSSTWTPSNDTIIYVDNDLTIGNHNRLNCANCPTNKPTAQRLQFYVNGNVNLGNQSELGVAIAAPNGSCGPGGQSSAGTQIYGSMICNELDNQGGWSFHYDTRLSELGADRYVITNWREEVGGSTSFS